MSEIKAGDILEVTLILHHDSPVTFMGAEFYNGETKRFKLLESYDVQESLCECYHCKWVKEEQVEIDYNYQYINWPIPVLNKKFKDIPCDIMKMDAEHQLTFHMFLNGHSSGSYESSNGQIIKWQVVPDDGAPYFAERIIYNKYKAFHT